MAKSRLFCRTVAGIAKYDIDEVWNTTSFMWKKYRKKNISSNSILIDDLFIFFFLSETLKTMMFVGYIYMCISFILLSLEKSMKNLFFLLENFFYVFVCVQLVSPRKRQESSHTIQASRIF